MSRTISFNVEVDEGNSPKTLKSLREELEAINEELEGVEVGSKAFTELSDKARKVGSEIKTIDKQLEGLEPQQTVEAFVKGFEGIAGSIAVATGTLTLFGGKSEIVQKAEEKLQSVIAIAVGARAAAEGLLQARIAARIIVEKAAAVSTKALTVAQRIYNTVLAANPIFAIVTVLATVTAGIYALTKALKADTKEAEFNADAYEKLADALERSNTARAQEIELAQAQGVTGEELLELQLKNARAASEEATAIRVRAQRANQFSDETKKARETEAEAIRQVQLAEARLETFRRDEAEKAEENRRKKAQEDYDRRKKEREDELKEYERFYLAMVKIRNQIIRENREFLSETLIKDINKANERMEKDFENRIKNTTKIATMERERSAQRSISTLQAYVELADQITKSFVQSTAFQTTQELAGVANSFFSDLLATQDESNKEGFEKSKKYKVAQVITTSTQAAFDAFAGAQKFNAVVPGLGTAIGIALVSAIAAKTRSSIAEIRSAQFGSTSSPSTGGGGGGTNIPTSAGGFTPIGQQPAGTQLTPQFAAPVGTFRAYVIGQDIADANEADARLNRRRTLGGG